MNIQIPWGGAFGKFIHFLFKFRGAAYFLALIFAVKEVANDGVAGGDGACDFVGFVFASDLLFFIFL
jgi:hypothetical protein